jgi:hypothetical protein
MTATRTYNIFAMRTIIGKRGLYSVPSGGVQAEGNISWTVELNSKNVWVLRREASCY